MTMLDKYAEALFPDTHRVLGRRLQPLTIGHLLLLHRLRSPIVTGEGVIDATAIATVVWLCSMPYARAVRASQSRWIPLRIGWLTLRAHCGMAAARLQLARYLAAGSNKPRWWTAMDSKGGEVSAPFWLSVQITLMRDLGRSPEQALATPASLAMWQCSAVWEEAGSIDLVSQEEADILSRVGPPEHHPRPKPANN